MTKRRKLKFPRLALIDTCTLLNLIQDIDLHPYIEILENLITNDKLNLLVPDQVKEEFSRHTIRVQQATLSSYRSAIKSSRRVSRFSDNPTDFENNLVGIEANLERALQAALEQAHRRVLGLIDNGITLASQDADFANAAKRSVAKLAPCHLKNKNSVADALIFEIFARILDDYPNQVIYFVTDNTDDFSTRDGDKRVPHPDIAETFDHKKVNYEISLSELLRNLNDVMTRAQTREAERLALIEERKKAEQQALISSGMQCPRCKQSSVGGIAGWGPVFPDPAPQWYRQCNACGTRIPTGEYIDD